MILMLMPCASALTLRHLPLSLIADAFCHQRHRTK